jgi:DNA-binding transcriptional ArsR family regulator
VNYHLRTLERHGLVELVEERRKGNMTERLVQATAASYVISPTALAAVAPDPDRAPDRLSAFWLLALAARLVRDVGALLVGARKAGKRVATFAIDGEVRFASAADRSAFAEELSHAVAGLVAKYHDQSGDGGRPHRLIVAIHPSVRATVVAAVPTTPEIEES